MGKYNYKLLISIIPNSYYIYYYILHISTLLRKKDLVDDQEYDDSRHVIDILGMDITYVHDNDYGTILSGTLDDHPFFFGNNFAHTKQNKMTIRVPCAIIVLYIK